MNKYFTDNWFKKTPADFYPLLLIFLSLTLHLAWMYHTNYTEEDAFITFRISRQIASGNGFVYNNEPVYGSTTPLLTLLLAVWIKFISANVILAARILNIFAVALTLVFTWRALKLLNIPAASQMDALLALITSSSLIYMNTQGMETPIGLSLLAGSWYFWLKGKFNITALMCGLLLWVRIDFAFWVLILILFTALASWRDALRIALIAGGIYLPWIIFAFLYFGSPIPLTATAKWVAYNQIDSLSYWAHLSFVLEYLSPFRTIGNANLWGMIISAGLAVFALSIKREYSKKGLVLLAVFIIFEGIRLTLTRTTYFNRYFVPILWATLILAGIGLGGIWERVKSAHFLKQSFLFFILVLFLIQVQTSLDFAERTRERQLHRYEQSLTAIGLWLKDNTDPNSVILLEPLGYIGYYSERTILDEVGLVTPAVVELKRQKINAEQYAYIFKPDYLIIHCDDLARNPAGPQTGLKYTLAKTFNPLGFYHGMNDPYQLAWSACYQIWENTSTASH
jgi:hypothetical protein